MTHVDRITLAAPTSDPRHLVVEPWGDQIVQPLHADWVVVARSMNEGSIEIATHGDVTVIFGWPGSTLSVMQDGLVVHDYPTEVPPTPSGLSVRDFLGVVLGKQDGE